jgi:hypothetical protein
MVPKPEEGAMSKGRKILRQSHPLIAVSLLAITSVVGYSCDMSCDGGSWQNTWRMECKATGSATLSAPAKYSLPKTIPVVEARSCMDTNNACSNEPEVYLSTSFTYDTYGISLVIYLPPIEGVATYTLPMPPVEPYAKVDFSIQTMESGIPLELVSGIIDVESSSQLHVSFTLEFEQPSTMEKFSLAGTAEARGCSSKKSKVCIGGD